MTAVAPSAAWVDGLPLTVRDVDARLARMRGTDRAGALPAEGTREWRQLRRWVTQVLVVEWLCRAEVASAYGAQPVDSPSVGSGPAANALGQVGSSRSYPG